MSSGTSSKETCHKETAEDGPSLFQNGKLVIQTHHIGWIVTGFFAIVATLVSFWLINKHLQWYTNKREQRYIVRLLFMVPIYALISFASYLFWNHSTPLLLIRDGYESTVLTAFFYLLLMYLSSEPEEQKSLYMRVGLSRMADDEARRKGETVKKWVFPLGFVKWKPQDGLYFLQLMKWGVLQYCVIRPSTTLVAVILDYMGLYCEESWGLGWGHVYITIIVSISVTIAMYCLIQLYVPVASYLAPHKPLFKLFAIKAVVFLTFWQATFLSVLSIFGVVKDTKYMTAADINIGIGALLETFEMMIFAFLHIRAFTYKPYRLLCGPHSKEPPPPSTPRLRSLGHAMDFRETFREIWIGCIYVLDKVRGREPAPDVSARRVAHYESAFGRPRHLSARRGLDMRVGKPQEKNNPSLPVEIEVEEQVEVDIEGERQWLGLGDSHQYGIEREGVGDPEARIEKELERRGYTSRISDKGYKGHNSFTQDEPIQGQRKQPSWWRRIYSRISESGPGIPEAQRNLRRQRSFMPRECDGTPFQNEYDYSDPPPPSIIRTHRGQHLYRPTGSWERHRDTSDGFVTSSSPVYEEDGGYNPPLEGPGEAFSGKSLHPQLDLHMASSQKALMTTPLGFGLRGHTYPGNAENGSKGRMASSDGPLLPCRALSNTRNHFCARPAALIPEPGHTFSPADERIESPSKFQISIHLISTATPSHLHDVELDDIMTRSLHHRQSATHHPPSSPSVRPPESPPFPVLDAQHSSYNPISLPSAYRDGPHLLEIPDRRVTLLQSSLPRILHSSARHSHRHSPKSPDPARNYNQESRENSADKRRDYRGKHFINDTTASEPKRTRRSP